MHRKGFTLLELLIVIAILAVLATVAVLVINPMEYLRQSRDAKRIGDMEVLNKALSLAEFENVSLGSASTTVFVSLVDTVASCANLGLPQLPTGYQYNCVTTAANLKKTDGTGWIPVNLGSITGGAPLAVLPIDPINNAAAFYSYIPGGSFAFSATLESEKYLKQSALPDGGTNPGKIEIGSDINLLTKAEGLAGYWNFDEGTGVTAYDKSGNGNNGAIVSVPTWVDGKTGKALNFDGIDDHVDLGNPVSLQITGNQTIALWINPSILGARRNPFAKAYGGEGTLVQEPDGRMSYYYGTAGANTTPYQAFSLQAGIQTGQWKHIALVRNFNTSRLLLYVNGEFVGNAVTTYSSATASALSAFIGKGYVSSFGGVIDDVRVYNRAVSASEIKALYDATK